MQYEVRFSVKTPDGIAATPAEIAEWLRFYLRDGSSIANDNPLIDNEPEPMRGTFRAWPTPMSQVA